jgi:hypothetical protein
MAKPGQRVRTAWGTFTADPVPISQLRVRDWFVVTDTSRTVYEVTPPPRHGARRPGWVFVLDQTMTDAEARRRLAEPGAVEKGESPRAGFFSYPGDTVVLRLRK